MLELIKIRKTLHQYPEVSDKEKYTAEYVLEILRKTGKWKITKNIGGYGIWAFYDSGKPGKHVAFRADMDALPIQETSNIEHKSKVDGVSHVCGHDGHMTILLGLAERLQKNKIKNGKVSLVFQPSEENGQGAERMMDDKKFDAFDPDYFYAIHNLPGVKKHRVVCKKGTISAASVGLKVELTGVGGHAGNPNLSCSPTQTLAELIKKGQLYKVDEEKGHFKIISIVHVKTGELSFGTIPSHATFAATLRASDDKKLATLKSKMEDEVKTAAERYKVKYETEWLEWFPAVVNKEKAFNLFKKAVEHIDADFEEPVNPFRWSEDFGLFSRKHPTTLIGIGAGKDQPPLHQSDYDFPDDIMEGVIELYMEIVKQTGGYE